MLTDGQTDRRTEHIMPSPPTYILLQVQKLKSTYVDGMLTYLKDGVLKTRWDHTAAATGRLTSACPNIQAVPRLPVTLQPLPGHGINLTLFVLVRHVILRTVFGFIFLN